MDKNQLRKLMRRKRAELPPEQVRAWSKSLTQHVMGLPVYQRAETLFLYVSTAGEPDTHPLLEDGFARGKRIYVPRCQAGFTMETVEITSMEDLERGYYGLLEPKASLRGEERLFDLMLLPALACGLDGTRLGQGRGYYDRFLEQRGEPHAVLCFEAFLLPTLPTHSHDISMKSIVTEERVLCYE